MQRKRNTPPLLVEMQIGTTTLESSMANSQKIGNHSSSRPSHTTLGHKSKEGPVIPQGHMLNYVHSSIICNSQNLETTKCHSTEEWIRKMWYMYTMEYYAAEKNNDFMKFAGKWMELENVILSQISIMHTDQSHPTLSTTTFSLFVDSHFVCSSIEVDHGSLGAHGL
ncbi:hypothetical protein STEG23_027324 [Scotinomys teguina]